MKKLLIVLLALAGCKPEPPVYAQPPWRIVSEVVTRDGINPASIWKTVDSDNGATIYVVWNGNGTCSVAVLGKD